MKSFLTILLVIASFGDLDKIAIVNKLKKEAKTAYLAGDYQEALTKYKYLTDSLNVIDDDITLNLTNAYYHLNDTSNAINGYSDLLDSKNRLVKSVAHQQLGIMSNKSKKHEEALDHFKQALRANPANEEARYNYEMLKKFLDNQKKQDQDQNKDDKNQDDKDQEKKDQEKKDQKNKDQEKDDQENKDGEGEKSEEEKKQEEEQQKKEQEQKDQEGEKSEEQKKKEEEQQKEEQQQKEGEEKKDEGKPQPQSLSDKLKDMKITEDKAKMILEAMKNNEIQYYQQQKKKATKKRDKSKPDW